MTHVAHTFSYMNVGPDPSAQILKTVSLGNLTWVRWDLDPIFTKPLYIFSSLLKS